MKYGEITRGQDEAMTNMLGGYEKFTKVLRGELVVRLEEVAPDQFVLDLNYDAYPSREKMFGELVSAGRYNWVNPDCTFEHYRIEPCSGIWRVTCDLVHPNKTHRTEDALFQMGSLGLRRPRIEHCLAFGAKYPEEQRKFPIVIGCSPWVYRSGIELLPVLLENAGSRELGLDVVGSDWGPLYRWLAVRTEGPLGA